VCDQSKRLLTGGTGGANCEYVCVSYC
jgi:hypothetical protein